MVLRLPPLHDRRMECSMDASGFPQRCDYALCSVCARHFHLSMCCSLMTVTFQFPMNLFLRFLFFLHSVIHDIFVTISLHLSRACSGWLSARGPDPENLYHLTIPQRRYPQTHSFNVHFRRKFTSLTSFHSLCFYRSYYVLVYLLPHFCLFWFPPEKSIIYYLAIDLVTCPMLES